MGIIRLISFSLLLLLVACGGKDGLKPPRPYFLSKAPEGPPEYVQAWNDGCDTGQSVYTTDFYKAFYTYVQDPNLLENEVYYRTWTDAFNYCRHFMKTNLAYGFSLGTGGYFGGGYDKSTPYRDLRPERAASQEGFAFPLWDAGIKLPSLSFDLYVDDENGGHPVFWGTNDFYKAPNLLGGGDDS